MLIALHVKVNDRYSLTYNELISQYIFQFMFFSLKNLALLVNRLSKFVITFFLGDPPASCPSEGPVNYLPPWRPSRPHLPSAATGSGLLFSLSAQCSILMLFDAVLMSTG